MVKIGTKVTGLSPLSINASLHYPFRRKYEDLRPSNRLNDHLVRFYCDCTEWKRTAVGCSIVFRATEANEIWTYVSAVQIP